MVRHPDPDDLALFAVSPADEPAVEAHLADCEVCRAEVGSFHQAVDLAALSNFGELTARPGDHVWDAIAAELGLSDGVSAPTDASTSDRVPAARESREAISERTVPASAGSRSAAETNPSEVEGAAPADLVAARAARTERRRPRWVAPLAALIVGAALGAGVLAISQRDSVDVEAVAPLAPVAGGPLPATAGDLGKAQLVLAGGSQRLHIEAQNLPSIPGAYEVWLFGNDGRMVSLGALDRGEGDFAIPQGISTGEYRTVDVSDEPADGNPAHSGISVARGSFS